MSKRKSAEASRLLLESERGSSSSLPAAAASGRKSPIEELFSCLTGGDASMKRKEIECALKSNIHELLKYPEVQKALEANLKSRQKTKNLTDPQKLLKCYQLCDDVLNGSKQFSDYRDDIDSSCYFKDLDDDLEEAVENDSIDECLKNLRQECATRLGNDQQYADFKEKLLKRFK